MRIRVGRLDGALTPWLSQQWSRLRWLLLALALVAIAAAALWPLPALLTRHPSHGLSAAERLKATNDVRITLVQALGGLALLGGLFFTARTFGLGREGQLTDRYTKAVEQLGNEKLDVRLGGIYALERLMVDSPRDHPTIVEVLAAFLREHATTPTSATSAAAWPLAVGAVAKQENIPRAPMPPPMPADTAAATRVIARRPPGRDERGHLDLHRCYLSDAILPGANLFRANLFRANLFRANLFRANLFRAILSGANLFRAILPGAILPGANLSGAILPGANLFRAILSGANLSGAILPGANLFRADLSGADLSEANLSDANLSRALGLTREQLNGATSTEGATLPDYLAEDSS